MSITTVAGDRRTGKKPLMISLQVRPLLAVTGLNWQGLSQWRGNRWRLGNTSEITLKNAELRHLGSRYKGGSMGRIHAATLEGSKRLQRVAYMLSDYREYTTRQIVKQADVCAVNTIVQELRENGLNIACRCITRGVYGYTMQKRGVL